jgi:small GTP-binding protein
MATDEFNIKLTPVGDGAVGKTSILTSYTQNEVKGEYEPTVFDNYSAAVTVNGEKISLSLADTAGQEDFESLRHLCYPNTDIFFVVFSVDKRTSFDNAKAKWIPEIQDKKKVKNSYGVPIIVIGNKTDLRATEPDCVTKEEGEAMVRALMATGKYPGITSIKYMECSALQNNGVKEIFHEAIKQRLVSRNKASKKSKCTIS